jgi:putative pyruvate formate lyase activating enzyme
MRIAALEPHLGEEPPISGSRGSGTIFFAGCSLQCQYCQNAQISREGLGRVWTVEEVMERIADLQARRGIHNIHFVTPDHFLPHTVRITEALRQRGMDLPTVYNLSGYQRVESLRMIEPWADIYLPDFKYSDPNLAARLSNASDYPGVALDALAEMVRQKGFLDVFPETADPEDHPREDSQQRVTARRGVLVRHLILPGELQNSCQALTMLFLEFGPDLPLSLMSQYAPVRHFPHFPALNRALHRNEFDEVLGHASALGFERLYVQYPETWTKEKTRPFVPDFSKDHPFEGNLPR